MPITKDRLQEYLSAMEADIKKAQDNLLRMQGARVAIVELLDELKTEAESLDASLSMQ